MEILLYILIGLTCIFFLFLLSLGILDDINSIRKTEEEKFYDFKISIERLTKVLFYKFETYDIEIAIQTYKDIAEYYPKFKDKLEYQEFIKYKLDWINQNKNIDEYYKSILIEIYKKNII
jgi:hypothetical protein